ncbi:hypothetical protein [Pseudopedobacter beijingensis]|uniref:Uncharacterized protein n=1 Tax=Pseudopedobacter beijingensis TaxID=1207056 RepID=A0ABW4IFA8_9SPHI
MNPYTLRNEDFIDRVDVICPKCQSRALVTGGKPHGSVAEQETHVKFTCVTCGYALFYKNTPSFAIYKNSSHTEKKLRPIFLNSPCDPFFAFNLWYKTDTTFGVIWAYNLKHLLIIEDYIADKLRERHNVDMQNNSIASRLPQWIKSAKNRSYLLKIIHKLKQHA